MKSQPVDPKFLELVNQHQNILHRVCTLYESDSEERKDLFQEILYQVWKSYPQFRGGAKFSTFIYRIALNTAITRLRKRNRFQHVNFDQVEEELFAIDDFAQKEQRELLDRAINQLNQIDKAIIMLYLDGVSYKEISDILGLSESNVGFKLNHIKHKLQKIVQTVQ